MMTHDEMIAVIAHHRDGGKIEYKHVDNTDADYTLDRSPSFDFVTFDYRVKPEPRSLWVLLYPSGLVHSCSHQKSVVEKAIGNGFTMHEYREVLP